MPLLSVMAAENEGPPVQTWPANDLVLEGDALKIVLVDLRFRRSEKGRHDCVDDTPVVSERSQPVRLRASIAFKRNAPRFKGFYLQYTGANMSQETPKDDPRQRADQKTHKQTDKPWRGNPEQEQRNEADVDLENWQKTNTH
ncbi:hypothetical protein [Bradyrhizobium commune]|uniref:Uncharacterized protein n=1 Tax=Bradyrhizobium commune TaxID=83627 RepID=A0A7S9DCS6_9BRAD|nr:hypothetical protein [Bradyrhizobium commune]QPF95439.1 hypothetical protein IC761_27525 [Bradyrhizobium commune]